jgi:transposase-like protein
VFDLTCLLFFEQETRVITTGIKTRIRTLHLREKKSISAIARTLGLSRNTVKKWLNTAQEVEPR